MNAALTLLALWSIVPTRFQLVSETCRADLAL
jgi:hypothetical protein